PRSRRAGRGSARRRARCGCRRRRAWRSSRRRPSRCGRAPFLGILLAPRRGTAGAARPLVPYASAGPQIERSASNEESMPLPALLAPPLRSELDPRSEAFAENRAAMLEKLAEIDRLLDEAEAGGGAYHHERLAKRGKLPVRERIARALDPHRPCPELSPRPAY